MTWPVSLHAGAGSWDEVALLDVVVSAWVECGRLSEVVEKCFWYGGMENCTVGNEEWWVEEGKEVANGTKEEDKPQNQGHLQMAIEN
jgi:hypothetical protein